MFTFPYDAVLGEPSTTSKTIDIEEHQRLFFSKHPGYGGGRTPLVGFFSRSQLEEGLMHAAPAHEDCLDSPCQRPEFGSHNDSRTSLLKPIPIPPQRRNPYLPPEIQMQIISHYAEPPKAAECGFCHLFALSTACLVNKLWYHDTMKVLYSTITLDIANGEHTCDKHFHLLAKHVQMAKRIPLLVRTLEQRPDLASMVRRIQLPNGRKVEYTKGTSPGALGYWVNCELEKKWLPKLLRLCVSLEGVYGLEDVLSQLFNGEHFCLDDTDDEQDHGFVAQSLIEKTSLKKWVWGRGHLRKLGDRVAGNYNTFSELHGNWCNLEHLGIIGLSGLTTAMVKESLNKLPALKSVTLGLGEKMSGSQEEGLQAEYLRSLLPVMPEGVQEVTLLDSLTPELLDPVLEWVDAMVGDKMASGKTVYPVAKDALIFEPPSSQGITTVIVSMDREIYTTRFWQVCRDKYNYQHFRVMVRQSSSDQDIVEMRIFI